MIYACGYSCVFPILFFYIIFLRLKVLLTTDGVAFLKYLSISFRACTISELDNIEYYYCALGTLPSRQVMAILVYVCQRTKRCN